jgi:hypothetical protein
VYGVLKNCVSVINGCEYNESLVDVYEDKLRSVSVILERREKKKEVRVVVCEYNGSVVDMYEDKKRECECRCGEKRVEEKG